MNPIVRSMAALMLAFMVPVQAGAALCAQLCATAAFAHDDAAIVAEEHVAHVEPADHHDAASDTLHGHRCDKSDAAGKCCQGHAAMLNAAVPATAVSIPSFERAWLVARWTNFIPEEPSPPPIAA